MAAALGFGPTSTASSPPAIANGQAAPVPAPAPDQQPLVLLGLGTVLCRKTLSSSDITGQIKLPAIEAKAFAGDLQQKQRRSVKVVDAECHAWVLTVTRYATQYALACCGKLPWRKLAYDTCL